jgi:hypothetical protein
VALQYPGGVGAVWPSTNDGWELVDQFVTDEEWLQLCPIA